MFSLKQATILALVGSAFAAPLARRDGNVKGRNQGNQGFEIVGNKMLPVTGQPAGSELVGYTTITIYPGTEPTSTYQAPSATAAVTVTTTTEASSTDDSSSSSASSTSSSSSGGGVGDYMSVVNEWRSKGGLAALTQDSTLEGNAQKTVDDGHGQMVHELNPGSLAQVLAPGATTDFEHVYVGGWLCEISSLPGLDGICATESKGWSYDGQTGHATILTDPKYKKIGCAWSDSIWGCDLA